MTRGERSLCQTREVRVESKRDRIPKSNNGTRGVLDGTRKGGRSDEMANPTVH